MKWLTYKNKQHKAQKIYRSLYGTPQTHKDWAESFNIIGKIIRCLE